MNKYKILWKTIAGINIRQDLFGGGVEHPKRCMPGTIRWIVFNSATVRQTNATEMTMHAAKLQIATILTNMLSEKRYHILTTSVA